jgi:cobalt/nickel transport system permease protein
LPELYIDHNSPINRLDARVKVIFTLAFILSLSLTPNRAWAAYILFLTITLSIALLSRLGLVPLFKRALLALPFALAALPLIFSTTLPHTLWINLPGFQVSVSPEGTARFASIALKAWISVQAAILLAATTRFPDLLSALQRLKVPAVFIAISGLMWRYLFVISDEVSRSLRARSSRSGAASASLHTGGSLFWRARVTGGMAGSLFLRSIERSDRVYAAMLSRGYTGELPARESYPFTRTERGILVLSILLLILLWLLGILSGG